MAMTRRAVATVALSLVFTTDFAAFFGMALDIKGG
jgi:hypothetical protein